MTVPFLNMTAQIAPLHSHLLEAAARVLTSGHFILGPEVAAFEREIAGYVGSTHAIGVNSGSDALTLALKALDIGPGDEVITTPFTYIAPAESIHQCGAKIVFADIDPETFCIDPIQVEGSVTSNTRAILPVHLFGQAAPLDALEKICETRRLHLVEDCAQSIGAVHRGRRLGSVGVFGCFSFYPTKNLGAAGDGGMVVTSDEKMAKKLRMLRVHGIEKRYFHDLHGVNSRLDEIQAAMLRVKLPHLEKWNHRRAEIASIYDEGLKDLPLSLPVVREGNSHIFHVYAVLSNQRDELHRHLTERGVPCLIYYPQPLHLQKVYEDKGWSRGQFPVAEKISETVLPLPMYPELTREQLTHVISCIRSFFRK